MATSRGSTATYDNYRKRTEDCKLCFEIKSYRKLPLTEKNKIFLDVPVEVINSEKKKKKTERKEFTNELGICVSALHNSKGGALLVHINGLDTEDNFLDSFHELVDEKLNLTRKDGTLFINSYKKYWLSDHDSKDVSYHGFVVIKVAQAKKVVTADFKTKVPLDNSILDPSTAEIESFLQNLDDSFILGVPQVRGPSLTGECRYIQFKSTRENPLPTILEEQADYIWNTQRLKHYISSFSKTEEGGSFFLGVAENEKLYKNYTSKIYIKEGFLLSKEEQSFLKKEILKKARNNLGVYLPNVNSSLLTIQERKTCDKKDIAISDFITVAFHSIEHSGGRVFLEVAVSPVNGLVFYDSNGPESYFVDREGEIEKKQFSDWLECLHLDEGVPQRDHFVALFDYTYK